MSRRAKPAIQAPVQHVGLTAGEFEQAVDTARAQLARMLDKHPGIQALATRLDAHCEGFTPVSVFGAAVELLHKACAVLIAVGADNLPATLSAVQRRAITSAAVNSLVFAALATSEAQPIEPGATVAAPEGAQ